MDTSERGIQYGRDMRTLGKTARLVLIRFAPTVVTTMLAACAGEGGVTTEQGHEDPASAKDVAGVIDSGGSTNQGNAFGADARSVDDTVPSVDDGQDRWVEDTEPACAPTCEEDEQAVWGCIAIQPGDPGAVTQCVDGCWNLVEICSTGTQCVFQADLSTACTPVGA
jgi:hypothetical protein